MDSSERGKSLYEKWALLDKYYYIVDTMIGYYRKKAIKYLDIDKRSTVADIGCGHGRSLSTLHDSVGKSGTVVGVDYSSGMVTRTQDRYKHVDNIHVVQADARLLPFKKGSFDGALSSYTLSTIPDPKTAIKSIHDGLTSDGRLVVLDYNCPQGLRYHLVKYFRKFSYNWQGVDLIKLLDQIFSKVYLSKFQGGTVNLAIAIK